VDYQGSGGGFLPENEDDDDDMMGGGFLPDDTDDAKDDSAENDAKVHIMEEHWDLPADGAGPEHRDNTMHAAPSDSSDEDPAARSPTGLDTNNLIVEPSDAASIPNATSSPRSSKANLEQEYSQSSLPLHRRQSEDEDSIMSHDPEDEDAEPDWLESD
jgi:xeroderma pigmentosum group C-complementing protein